MSMLGGKCREAADCYTHAAGAEIPETIANARQIMSEGSGMCACRWAFPGMAGYGAGRGNAAVPALHDGPVFEPAAYMRRALQLFEACRKELGDEIELLHDVHERLNPIQAVRFAKDVEKFRLFFLEDVLAPEDIDYFRLIRKQCATQLAMGELFTHPLEWTPLISERLIDFIRIHPSFVGGLTPARKVAAFGEAFNVRTAWHGPGDLSPIGSMCNITSMSPATISASRNIRHSASGPRKFSRAVRC